MQKDGTYSVVPRVPGGEITPEKLIVIGAGGEEVRPVHQDHRRPAHRPVRRAGASAAADLEGTHRCRLRIRPRLRQGGAHGEELRGLHLVPLRRAGQRRPRDRSRESLQGPARASQDQVRGVRLHARVRRGAEQGRRRHRHRRRLEPLRLRQRRHEAAPRRPAGARPRYADAHQVHRPLPDVLHPHGATGCSAPRPGSRTSKAASTTCARWCARTRSASPPSSKPTWRASSATTPASGRWRSKIRRRSSASGTS